MKSPNPGLGRCKTPVELAEAIAYHLKQGGMRLEIYEHKELKKTVHDDHETYRVYGIALDNYNEIRKTYPKLPPIQINTSDPLSGIAQIQQLCTERVGTSNFLWKLYEKTLKVFFDSILGKMLPK